MTSTHPDLFTPTLADAREAGRRSAEVCTENARKEQQDWPERAYAALCDYIRIKAAFRPCLPWSGEQAVEFVLRQPGIERPHDDRAFGSIFARAARAGLIRRSPTLFPRRRGHGSLSAGWEAV